MDNNTKVLNKKDVMSAWAHWQIYINTTMNYERMTAIDECGAMSICLEKLYKDNPEGLKRALQRHLVFFNTNANWGAFLGGALVAMEEEMYDRSEDEKDAIINNFKISLMGPLAGLGDTIDWATLKPIILGIGVALVLNGQYLLGCLVSLSFSIITCAYQRIFWYKGYQLGRDAIVQVMSGNLIKYLIDGASILAMFMMGNLTASYVYLATSLEIPTGDATLPLQEVLDGILPGLLPLAAVFLIYLFMKKKSEKIGLISVIIIAVCILGCLLGVF